MKGLIMDALRLPTRPYCSGLCPEGNLSKVVDSEGQNAGLSTFVEAMVEQLEASATTTLYLNTEVTAIEEKDDLYSLRFRNGSSISAKKVILNLAVQPLLGLLRRSPLLTKHVAADSTSKLPALHHVRGADSAKLYVHYDDAWWINDLNLTYGYFNNSDTAQCQTSGTAVPQYPPLMGRYHDGHVRCDLPGGRCRGMLEVAYVYDSVSVAFYRTYLADAEKPYVVLPYSDWEGKEFLDALHEQLLILHHDQLQRLGAFDRVAQMRPSLGALSVWDRMAVGFGAGIHDWMRDASPSASCHSFTECQAVMPQQVMQPLGEGREVYVVNEAYGSRSGWCEGSLSQAENVLHRFFGVAQPLWISAATYQDWVLYNSSVLSGRVMSSAHP